MNRARAQEPSEATATSGSDWSLRRVLLPVGLVATLTTALALSCPWWVVLALLVVLPLTLLIRRFRPPLWCLSVLSAVILLVTTTGYQHRMVRPVSHLSGRQDVVTGQVLDVDTGRDMVQLRVSQSEWVPAGTRMALFCPSEFAPVGGDTVTAHVIFQNPEESGVHIAAKDVFLYAALVEEDEAYLSVSASDEWNWWDAAWLRKGLTRSLSALLPGTEGGMLMALCLGVRSGLPASVTDAFRQSGLAHLLVVSGLHLTLVAAACRRLFRRVGLSYRLSAALTMPVVIGFMWLVGFSPSVCRAGVMCLVWLGGYLLGRRPDGLNSLGLAAALLLMQNPYTLLNAGFQLSFLATAGILLLTPRLCRRVPYPDPAAPFMRRTGQWLCRTVWMSLAVCFSALLFTAPVVCYYFDGFPLLTPVANLLAVTPAGWTLLLGWVGLLLSLCPFLHWLAQPILYLAGLLTRFLLLVAKSLSTTDLFLTVHLQWQWLLLTALCLLLAVGIACRLPWRRWLTCCVTLAVLFTSVASPVTWFTTRLQVSAVPGGAAVVLTQRGHTALLLTDGSGLRQATYEARGWGCSRLDAVVVGQGTPREVAYLSGLTEQTGHPVVYTATTQNWTSGAARTVASGTTLTLWEGCRLTLLTDRWWLLETGDATVLLGQGADTAPPTDAGLTLWVGVPTAPISGHGVVVCSTDRLAQQPLYWGENTDLLSKDSVTYIARSGNEWSVLPWL